MLTIHNVPYVLQCIRHVFQDYLRDNGLYGLVDRVSLSDCPLRGLSI